MHHLPNLITSVRLFSALLLLALTVGAREVAAGFFLVLFVSAGISDMLDGYLARRFNWCTEFGARLDSISDLSLYIAGATFLLSYFGRQLSPVWYLIELGALLQVFHLVFSYFRLGEFPAYHTNFSRVCAYLIFLLVIAFWQNTQHPAFFIGVVACLWSACSLEGLVISCLLKSARSNISGVFFLLKQHKQCPGESEALL